MNTLTIIRGDSTLIPVTFTDAGGTAINLTNVTVFFTVKRNQTDADADALIKKDVTSHTYPTQGKTSIILTPTQTNIEPGYYWWDLQIKTASGDISSTIPQRVNVISDITTRTS